MAYFDPSSGFSTGTGLRAVVAPALGSQDRLVVMLSRRDPLWSLESGRAGKRLLGFLFGIVAPHRLADSKLEALRRYAVTYRVDTPSVADAEQAALEAGYQPCELAQVRTLVDGSI